MLGLASVSGIRGFDEIGDAPPDEAGAVFSPHHLPLPVSEIIDDDARGASEENRRCQREAKVVWIVDQIERRRCVNGGNPDKTAPADVKTGAIVHDVERAEIPRFPEEKFRNVDELQENGDEHRIGQSIDLSLFRCIGNEDEAPTHHANAAVGELFDVPPKNARIQFSAPIVVKEGISSNAVIGARWFKNAFQIKKEAENKTEYIERA